MKIDLITNQPTAACSMFYSEALGRLPEVTLFDKNILGYDVILLMTYDHLIASRIREIHPRAKIGLVDPRNYEVLSSIKYCDFLVVDSIEMEDFWSIAKKPIVRYVEYPNIKSVKKIHGEKNTIKIGYHGNQIHLDCMQETVTPALSELSKKYQIELIVMYSGEPPSKNEKWVPRDVMVTHVPWSMRNYDILGECDIGIVPNNIVHSEKEKSSNTLDRKYNYSPDDYSLRFKMPSNPGRFVVFGKLGIPVVADFYPSALQYLREDLKTGMVACNPSGWEKSLERLIRSPMLRQELGDGLQSLVDKKFDFDYQNQNFLEFINNL